jgi:RNA polymerase primary sigma factor
MISEQTGKHMRGMERSKEDILRQMDADAALAAEDFKNLPDNVRAQFSAWIKKWYLTAGYKRLCRIGIDYLKDLEKTHYHRVKQLHFLFEKIKLTKHDRLIQYLKEIKQYSILNKQAEFALARKARESQDEAVLEKFVCSNLRIVVSLTKRFQGDRLSMLDLINAGNEGLIHAAQKFDERKGVRFYWYAKWWIRRAIYDALSKGRSIVPQSHLARQIQQQTLKAVIRKKRRPSDAQLAETLKVDEEKIAKARNELLPTYSLDVIYTELDRDLPEDSIEHDIRSEYALLEHDEHLFVPSLEKQHIIRKRMDALQYALDNLDAREREILMRNFGLGDYRPHSLQEIADILHLSRERIRQIKENALRKFRNKYKKAVRKT